MLVGRRNAFGKFLHRLGERTFLHRSIGYALGLRGDFLQKKFRRHELVGHAELHVGGHLLQRLRNLVQTRDVVLVVLDRGERRLRRHRREAEVRSAELVHGHLPFVEPGGLDGLAQVAHHELLVERFVVGKAGGVNRLKYFELLLSVFEFLGDGFGRIVAQLIVVAVVSDVGCESGIGAQSVFPLGLNGVTELRAARVEALLCLGGKHDGEGEHERRNHVGPNQGKTSEAGE